MKRIPLSGAIVLNIILLLAAFSGMLNPFGIFILVINIILTIPALLRYIAAIQEKRKLERIKTTQSIKILMDAMVHIIISEETGLHSKITALVMINDFFIAHKNRKYIYELEDYAGNKLNEYTMSLFIANHSACLMRHPQISGDFKKILEILSHSKESFATKRLEPTLKRALKKRKQEN